MRIDIVDEEHDLGGGSRRHLSADQPLRSTLLVQAEAAASGRELGVPRVLELERELQYVPVERDGGAEVRNVEDDVAENAWPRGAPFTAAPRPSAFAGGSTRCHNALSFHCRGNLMRAEHLTGMRPRRVPPERNTCRADDAPQDRPGRSLGWFRQSLVGARRLDSLHEQSGDVDHTHVVAGRAVLLFGASAVAEHDEAVRACGGHDIEVQGQRLIDTFLVDALADPPSRPSADIGGSVVDPLATNR
jgi:hypothetical protein